jgi:hypothetical protein
VPGPVLVAPKISRNYARARRVAFIRAYRQFVFGKLQKARNFRRGAKVQPLTQDVYWGHQQGDMTFIMAEAARIEPILIGKLDSGENHGE